MTDLSSRKFETVSGFDELTHYLETADKSATQVLYVCYQLAAQKMLMAIDMKKSELVYDDAFGRKMNPLMVDIIQKCLPNIKIVDIRQNERDIMAFSANQVVDPNGLNWERLDPKIAKEFTERKVPLSFYAKKQSAISQQDPEQEPDDRLKSKL